MPFPQRNCETLLVSLVQPPQPTAACWVQISSAPATCNQDTTTSASDWRCKYPGCQAAFNKQCYLTRHTNTSHQGETLQRLRCQFCSFTGTESEVLHHAQHVCPAAPKRATPLSPTLHFTAAPQLPSQPPHVPSTQPLTPPWVPENVVEHPGSRLRCELVGKHHHEGLYRLVLSFTSPGTVTDPDNFVVDEGLLHVLCVVELALTNNVSSVGVERVVKLFQTLNRGHSTATQRLPSTWRTVYSCAVSGCDLSNLVSHHHPVPPALGLGCDSVPCVLKPFKAVLEEVLCDPTTVDTDNFFFEVPDPVPEGGTTSYGNRTTSATNVRRCSVL